MDEAAPASNGLMGMPTPRHAGSASAPDAAVAALNEQRRADQSPDRTLALGEPKDAGRRWNDAHNDVHDGGAQQFRPRPMIHLRS